MLLAKERTCGRAHARLHDSNTHGWLPLGEAKAAGRTPQGAPGSVMAGSERGGDGLGLEVVVEDLGAHLAAPAGLLVAAERQRGVDHVMAVDPDGARAQPLSKLVGLADVARPGARGEAVFGVVADLCDRVEIVVGEPRGANHWPKNLL